MPKTAKLELPPLYHRTSSGQIRVWRVRAEGREVISEAGVQGGKMVESRRECEATNVGRSNARTPEQQAAFEAQADWENKRTRKYSEEVPGAEDELVMPMLAKAFYKKDGTLTPDGKRVSWPADLQPKFNGVRALARRADEALVARLASVGKGVIPKVGEVVLLSRNGRPYEVPHIKQQLERWLPEGMEVDGEIYQHGLTLQQHVSLVKRVQNATMGLKYQVYDVPRYEGTTGPWEERRLWIPEVVETASVLQVGSVSVASEAEVKDLHRRFCERGFEGAVIRQLNKGYSYGHRTDALVKVKAFQSGEFVVVGCEQGKGKDKGTATFVCKLDDGRTFKARMKGDIDARRAFWENRADYNGRKLTVEFFEWTKDEKPHCPVGVAFRDEADLPK